ncbi:MAG: copper homeostasis protein CutC [Clostridia bacterium]|nr:copper homeostasis protein CutC [Clostridia bacterium]
MSDKILFEVCCGCTEDAVQAEKGGADRIELNSALFLGGLTPSIGTVEEVKSLIRIPVMCMVRPREGGFCYTEYDYKTMCRDAVAMIRAGADGIVFGFLHEDGTVDKARTADFLRVLRREKPDIVTVFHRAIDVTPDVFEALDVLIELGVDRVLTSGQRASAVKGAETIRRMVEHAAGRIDILPGGGINDQNVHAFIAETGVRSVHASARSVRKDTSVNGNEEVFFGGLIDGKGVPEDEYKVTDPARVQAVLKAIEG